MAQLTDGAPRTNYRAVAAFLGIAFVFSWVQWVGVIASAKHWIPFRVPLTPFGSFGPAIAALCVLRARDGRRAWYRSIVRWRMPAFSVLTACLSLPLLAVVSFFIARRVSGDASPASFPSLLMIAAVVVETLILGGPLGEEPGWRGFLLPELRKSAGPLLSTLIVAAAWLAWHLPLYWVPGSGQQEIPFTQFAIALLAYSFVLTWLVERSGGSTLIAILFHTSANATFSLAAIAIKSKVQDHAFWPIYFGAICLLGAVFMVALWMRRETSGRRGREYVGETDGFRT